MGKLLNRLTALKSTAKSLQRQARKCEKEEKSEKRKNKKALEKGNVDGARIYAENAFRKQTERLNYLHLSSRLHAIVAYLGILDEMATLKESLRNIFRSLKSTLATDNIQNMPETTDMFEKQVTEFLELAASTFFSPSAGDVNSLMQQVADDYGHEISVGLPQPAAHAVLALETEKVDEDDLSKRRFALLKASDEIVYATAGKEN